LKVLQVIPYFAPAWQYGGPIHVVLGLSQKLAENGHEVTIATTTANGVEELEIGQIGPVPYEDLEVHYYRRIRLERWLSQIPYWGQTVGFFYAPDLKTFIRENIQRFDVLHLHEFFCYPAVVAAKIAKRSRVPYVIHTHGMLDPVRLGRRKLKKMLYLNLMGRRVLNGAHGIVAITEAERQHLVKLGIRSPITVIPNGVQAQDTEAVVRASSEHHGTIEDGRVVLFLGRIHPMKGLDLLVEAFARTASRRNGASLVIAGPDEIGYKNDLLKKCSALNLNGQLKFVGTVADDEKKSLLARADIFALTSYSEGFSMAILEALSYGKPVVITDTCYFDDVSKYHAGLVSPCDVGAIAKNLDTLLSDSDLRDRMGKNARRLIREKYTWDIVADKTARFYQNIVNGG
jgi:glycosyltransferase involved in cell wall biosynthesis